MISLSRPILLALGITFYSMTCFADTTLSGDSQVTGQVGIGTSVPQAQMHIQDDATDVYALRVSSANGTVFFAVLPNGNAGIGLAAPKAHLDINGTADNGDRALQLRVGNSSSTVLSQQIVFTSTAGTFGHAIATQHESDQALNNAVGFFLWNSTGQPNAAANLAVLSLAVPSLSTASVHVDPFGTPDVELEVSNGLCTGCGTILRAAAVAPSSRERKTDIAYLDGARRRRALEDVQSLRHAAFQYKKLAPAGPVMRGLIYEDAPQSVRGAGKTVVLDARVLNLEMALQEADKQITALEDEISELEKAKKQNGRK